ncbi:hypothetical protein E0486_10000 [Flaviaesturariibacter aridisoli]|uniref:Glycosyltransferase RgtA/B/C/D-like domain-containing protein n=1 Tax=Flaviaesturariibacter aridisoli TaxID=2545761 RepID=A0A4R4E0X5_9BACT|nr:hypothetical protein E0486_10000 [Flaviaesturariibacter aridisoli]
MSSYRRQWAFCAGVTALYFLSIASFLAPQYGTVEDLFVLYQLSGGFGTAPTELLHYNHIVNPIIGWPLKIAFTWMPSVNWYTLTLLAAQFVACTLIFQRLLRRNTLLQALAFYTFFFLVFETGYFSALNFTSTSIVLGMAGLLRLSLPPVPGATDKPYKGATLYASASLLRVHSLLPLLPLALPFWILTPGWKPRLRKALWLLAALAAIGALHLFHRNYYEKRIPGWQREEAYRQQVYAFYNHRNMTRYAPGDPGYFERRIIGQKPLLDTQIMTLPIMAAKFKATYKPGFRMSGEILRWFFVNNRLYFLSLLCAFLFLRRRAEWLALGASIAIAVAMWFALNYTYAKFPDYLLMAFLCFPVLLALSTRTPPARPVRPWLLLAPLLLAGWGFWIRVKQGRSNAAVTRTFVAAWRDFAAHRDTLFFVGMDQLPFYAYPVWAPPAKYPMPNVLISEHFLNHLERPFLEHFGLRSIRDLPLHPNACLAGWQQEDIRAYYSRVHGTTVRFEPVTGTYQQLRPYRVVLTPQTP